MKIWLLFITLVVSIGLSIPPARVLIEQSMLWQMIVQMPLLVVAGFLCGRSTKNKISRLIEPINRYGLTSFIVAMLVMSYWMLPIAVDRAIVLPLFDAAKIASLLISGFCLNVSLQRAPQTVQVFFVGYTLAMMLTLGIYFISVDMRLCNAYSQEDQIITGYGLIVLSCILGLTWLARIKSNK